MASSSTTTLTSAPPKFVTASGPTIATQNLLQQKRSPDVLDKTVTFLAKRDGIDKAGFHLHWQLHSPLATAYGCDSHSCMQVLKIIRYTSKLVLAGALSDPSSELAVRLKALESSIGTSR